MLNRIKRKYSFSLGKQHIKLLKLIADFYRTTRYSRYNLNSVYEKNQDLYQFINYLKEEINVKEEEGLAPMVGNSLRVKKFIGKIVGKITTELYGVVREETGRLNIYTHEILTYSKPYKIFIAKEFTFVKERHLQKELLVLIQSGKLNDAFMTFIKQIEPLPFENYDSSTYIRYLMDINNNNEILDEMESLLEDEPISKERLEKINLIGQDNLYFQGEEDWLDEDDE